MEHRWGPNDCVEMVSKVRGDDDKEEEAIPMWVHLEKVPLHMYSWEGLSFITSTVGSPVKPHPETISCSKMDEAKIFVKVDVSKVLPKEITFSKDGKNFTVKFYYPWFPARCKLCDNAAMVKLCVVRKVRGRRTGVKQNPHFKEEME